MLKKIKAVKVLLKKKSPETGLLILLSNGLQLIVVPANFVTAIGCVGTFCCSF